jgi:glycosyltransferase involved in cell wall biosynthesis
MRIGMILLSSYPPDLRVKKEIASLSKNHEIFMLCTWRGESSFNESVDEMKISRVMNKYQRWWANFNIITKCYSKTWEKEIDNFILANKLETLHVHDLPLLGTALKVAQKHSVPVVSDLHENFPAMLKEFIKIPIWKVGSLGAIIQKIFISINRWVEYEKNELPKADKIITVIEEARDRLIENGILNSKISVVPNYHLDFTLNVHKEEKSSINEIFTFFYAGGVDEARDLFTVIEAISYFSKYSQVKVQKQDEQEVQLIIVGANRYYRNKLYRYAKQKRVEHLVKIYEWIPLNDTEKIMNEAQVGLVPHVKSDHTDTTIPHKLFQYMSKGLPVIVSDCSPLERIVTDSKCGLVYSSGNCISLAECMKKIYQNPELIQSMRASSIDAINTNYNWDNAEKELISVYTQLAKNN